MCVHSPEYSGQNTTGRPTRWRSDSVVPGGTVERMTMHGVSNQSATSVTMSRFADPSG